MHPTRAYIFLIYLHPRKGDSRILATLEILWVSRILILGYQNWLINDLETDSVSISMLLVSVLDLIGGFLRWSGEFDFVIMRIAFFFLKGRGSFYLQGLICHVLKVTCPRECERHCKYVQQALCVVQRWHRQGFSSLLGLASTKYHWLITWVGQILKLLEIDTLYVLRSFSLIDI